MLRSIRRSRRAAYKVARVEGDFLAVASGHPGRRVARRFIGRRFARLLRMLVP